MLYRGIMGRVRTVYTWSRTAGKNKYTMMMMHRSTVVNEYAGTQNVLSRQNGAAAWAENGVLIWQIVDRCI